MHHPGRDYYRSLELLCRHQAKLSMTPGTRSELERMGREYKRMADLLEHQWPDPGPACEDLSIPDSGATAREP